ncbi:MAG: prepilin peptidase [Elusimicrobiota bacterium]
MPVFFVWGIAVFGIGACLGSFLNVVIHRLPKGESVIFPRSRCPKCLGPIAFYDNIPIMSWIWLRGRCRACGERISSRYPAVEAFAAAACCAVWLRWRQSPLWAAAACLASLTLVVVALIDWDTFLIPDELSLGLCALGIICAPINPLLRAWKWGARGSWLNSFLGAAFGFILCWAIAALGERIFKKEAMGGGDIKLLAAIGAWGGALGVFDALMIASISGAVYGGALMARKKIKRDEPIPFGPFLALGAMFNFFCLLPWGFPFV